MSVCLSVHLPISLSIYLSPCNSSAPTGRFSWYCVLWTVTETYQENWSLFKIRQKWQAVIMKTHVLLWLLWSVALPWLPLLSMLRMFCGCCVTTVVMVADVASDVLVLLVTKLSDIPVLILVAIITKDINVHWLLHLCEHTRSVFLCGYFVSCLFIWTKIVEYIFWFSDYVSEVIILQ